MLCIVHRFDFVFQTQYHSGTTMEQTPEFSDMRREVGDIISSDGTNGKPPSFFTRLFGEVWELAKIVVISLVIVLPIRFFIAQPFIVRGASMEPNFHNGEYLIIDEISYRIENPKRGDVIVFRYPQDPSQFFIKRIVGLPGETVDISSGRVFIHNADNPDGVALTETYLQDTIVTAPDTSAQLGHGEYFVMGDNRPASSDSRRWGVLQEHFVVGRALVRLWPPSDIGIIR